MSKKIIYGSIVTALLLFGIFLIVDNSVINTIETDGDMKIYKNVDELEQDSDLIVRVQATDQRTNVMKLDEQGIPLWYYTETHVLINKVYYTKDNNLKEHEEIVIYEPYGIFKDNIGKTEIKNRDYNKMNSNNNYVLFLQKHQKGGYMPIGVQQGQIDLDNSEVIVKDSLKENVLKKYK
jgi:hypothetical protein